MFETGGGGMFGDAGGGGLYGGLLDALQRQAIQRRGLQGFLGGFANSGALDYTVPFISGKVPGSFAKGLAAGAAGAGEAQDAAGLSALNAQLVGLKGQELKAKIGLQNQLANEQPPAMFSPSTAGPSTASPLGGDGMQPATTTGGGGGDGFTIPKLYDLAVQAGYKPGTEAATAAAISMAESSGNPRAFNGKGEQSYGLMQLNADAHGDLARTFDPLENMKRSRVVSEGGTNWRPWSVYKNGAYEQYLPDALAYARSGGGAMGGMGAVPPRSLADTAAAVANPAAPTGGLFAPTAAPVPAPGSMFPSPPTPPAGSMFAASPGAGPTSPGAGPQMMPGGGVSPSYVQWAQRRANIASLLGINVPSYVNEAAGLPLVQPKSAATAAGQYPFEIGKIREQENEDIRKAGPIASSQAWAKVGPDLATKWNEPQSAAPGHVVMDTSGRVTAAAPELKEFQDPRTGRMVQVWVTPPTASQPYGNIQPVIPGSTGPGGATAPNGLVGKMGPGEETEHKTIGEALGKEYGQAVESYRNAQSALPNLSAMQEALRDFRTGPFANDRLRLGKAWQDLVGTVGAQPDSELAKWVASGEIITKSGTRLGFELARTLGSREAQNIVQQAIATNPGLAASPQGNEQLVGLIRQGLQRDVDRRAFYDDWLQNGRGSLTGAATAFDRARPTEYYVSQVLPIRVTSKSQYDSLPNGTRYLDPNGTPRTKGYSSGGVH